MRRREIIRQLIVNRDYRTLAILKHIGCKKRYKTKWIRISGVKFHVPDVASFVGQLEEIIVNEEYSFVPQTDKQIIVDFGANIGVSVFYFSKKYPNAEIYAYEADPEIFRYLSENVAKFNNNHIHIFNQAISNKNGKIGFVQEGADAGHYSLDNDASICVESVDANDIMGSFDRIDLLKIDIEGSERMIIPALKNNINKIDYIFLEYHSEKDREQCFGEIINIFRDFRLYIKTEYCPQTPMKKIIDHTGFDLQLNIYGIKKGISNSNFS